MVHKFKVKTLASSEMADITAEVRRWLKQAYDSDG